MELTEFDYETYTCTGCGMSELPKEAMEIVDGYGMCLICAYDRESEEDE